MTSTAALSKDEVKKLLEKRYLTEARAASSLFPPGELVGTERPDFLLGDGPQRIGIEVTELCREEPRATDARLTAVIKDAEARYGMSGGGTVDMSAAFSHRAETLKSKVLSASLAAFVEAHRDTRGAFAERLPEGYCHIGIFDPLEPAGRWRGFKGFDVVAVSKDLLEELIADKNRRVPVYRDKAATVWLLIVNDLFLGAGEVHARLEDLRAWQFPFDFDKVLVFSRRPGGHGETIELRRL